MGDESWDLVKSDREGQRHHCERKCQRNTVNVTYPKSLNLSVKFVFARDTVYRFDETKIHPPFFVDIEKVSHAPSKVASRMASKVSSRVQSRYTSRFTSARVTRMGSFSNLNAECEPLSNRPKKSMDLNTMAELEEEIGFVKNIFQ